MRTQSLMGGFTDAPVQSSHAFRAALDALARPGGIHEVTGGEAPAPLSTAAATLLLTLCDAETPVHLAGACDTQAIRDWVTFHIGAPLVGPSHAMFAVGRWDALSPITRFPIGTPEYPDRSTTLIVEMDEIEARGMTLKGPGIKDTAALTLPEVTALRANAALFPLGLDFFLTCGGRLAGLPRTTQITEPQEAN